MRVNGRQARFLLATLGCWIGARAYLLGAERTRSAPPAAVGRADALAIADAVGWGEPAFTPWLVAARHAGRGAVPVAGAEREPWSWDREDREARLLLLAMGGPEAVTAARVLRRATFASEPAPAAAEAAVDPTPLLDVPPARPGRRGIEAQAYLFVRPGGGGRASLAGGGELGGSQIAARLAWRPSGSAFGIAARLYAPLAHRGAEAAAGIDWHPIGDAPLRVSIERRQRIDEAGRSAWAAYLAGGFYKGGGPDAVEIDGYAQAGMVGARRRDGFVDGALRIGYRLPDRRAALVLGAGLWGAAQPGVARVDAGPRAALRLAVAGHPLTLVIEERLRLAGHADPGSGPALTLAADF